MTVSGGTTLLVAGTPILAAVRRHLSASSDQDPHLGSNCMATIESEAHPVEQRRLLDRTILTVVSALTRLAWMIPWPVWSALAIIGGMVTMFSKRRHVVLDNVRHAR